MRDSDLRGMLYRWYGRPFSEETKLCEGGPRFHDLVEWTRSRRELSPEEASHVERCSLCRRTIVAIRVELAVIADGEMKGSESLRVPPVMAREGRPKPTPHLVVGRSVLKIGGLAAAAAIGVIILSFVWQGGQSRALGMDLREVGFAPGLPMASLWPGPLDEETTLRTEQVIAEARIELERALSVDGADAAPPWLPWTQIYRNLRALGRWEEALQEAHEFVAYGKKQDERPERYSMYYSGLFDLGNLYLATGDYDAALAYHDQSLTVARDYQEWLITRGPSQGRRPHVYAEVMAPALVPRHWALSTLSKVQGRRVDAWDHHKQAGDWLTDFFRQECAFRGLTVRGDPSLHGLCMAVVNDSDGELGPLVIKVREHLLRTASLLRLDRDLDAAARALDLAATLPDYPGADESRLDFNEPMERLRIAIARGDFVEALYFADEAEANTGPRHFEGRPMHAPIGLIARAELRFMRGVSLTGLNPNDPEALNLIESAIDMVSETAGSLPPAQRGRFLNRFTQWQDMSRVLTADDDSKE